MRLQHFPRNERYQRVFSIIIITLLPLARKKRLTRYMRPKKLKTARNTCRIKNQRLSNRETLVSFCGTSVYVVSHVFLKQFWKASYLAKFPLTPILFVFSFITHLQCSLFLSLSQSIKMRRNCNLELSLFHPSHDSNM